MGINAGAIAITGVYLGDQLLTKGGGGNATENIQAAIDAADTAELIHYMQGLETIAASPAAMQAIAASTVAMKELAENQTVMSQVIASQTAMQAITASPVAMKEVAASQPTIQAIAASPAAMQAITASTVAMQAIAASTVAMKEVAASKPTMLAIAASTVAMQAIAASTVAMDALYAYGSRTYSSVSGKLIILEISSGNYFTVNRYGWAQLSDGSTPSWDKYRSKYSYFRQFKTYCTYIKSDSDNDDWIYYYMIE